MHNSDLLIAQLQRRNRIMFVSMLAGLAMIAIGIGLVMLDATTELPPAPQTDTKPSVVPKKNAPTIPASASSEKAVSQSTADLAEPAASADPITATELAEDKKRFLTAVQDFNSDIKTKVALFPELAASTEKISRKIINNPNRI